MAQFFRTSQIWIVDFRFDGSPRRWFRPAQPGEDVPARMQDLLAELYGPRAELVEVRLADADEEMQYLRGEVPPNAMCPTGRAPRSPQGE